MPETQKTSSDAKYAQHKGFIIKSILFCLKLATAVVIHYQEISDLRKLGWPIQINRTFCNILRSRIITWNAALQMHLMKYEWLILKSLGTATNIIDRHPSEISILHQGNLGQLHCSSCQALPPSPCQPCQPPLTGTYCRCHQHWFRVRGPVRDRPHWSPSLSLCCLSGQPSLQSQAPVPPGWLHHSPSSSLLSLTTLKEGKWRGWSRHNDHHFLHV